MVSSTGGRLFDVAKIPFVVGSPLLVAHRVGVDARSDWDPHYGDPDGESIVEFFQVASGLATLLVAVCLVLVVEVVRRRCRRRPATTGGANQP